MRSFSVSFIYDKLEMFKDLLLRISKNELGPKNVFMESHSLKNAQIFIIFGDIVHDDVLGSYVFQLEQLFNK